MLFAKSHFGYKKSGRSDEKALDYVFIDESQDFPQSFIELCEMVTSKNYM